MGLLRVAGKLEARELQGGSTQAAFSGVEDAGEFAMSSGMT